MPRLGIGSSISKASIVTPGIVTSNLVLKHNYSAGGVVPVSDGAAYFVPGNNDYVAIGNQSNLSFGTGSFSVACWVNSNQTGTTSFILGKGSSTSTASSVGYALYLGNTGTDWVFSVGDGTDYEVVETTVTQNANQWYHLCGTFNGTSKQLKLYVDGVLIETDADTDIGDIDNSDAFDIGRLDASASNDWDGYICNVGVWSDVLTQAQIKSIMWKNYANLTSSETTNLVSWWNLDSNIGDTTSGTPTGAAHIYDNHHGGSNALGSEIISNTTFDSNITGWDDYSPGVVSHETSIVYSGSGALRTTSSGGNIWLGRHPVANLPGIETNTSYLVTGRAYIPTGWDGGHLFFTDGSSFGGDESFIKADSSTLDQWQETTMVVDTASDSTGVLYLRCASNPSAGKYVIWDSISMKKINGNTGVCK